MICFKRDLKILHNNINTDSLKNDWHDDLIIVMSTLVR